MKLAITGTRGIPNHYGGFEKFAEKLSIALVRKGFKVIVHNPDFHPYKEESLLGVDIIRHTFHERMLGPAGNFLFDLKCLKDSISQNVDLILECGYASAAPWYPFLNRKGIKLITHMDGMEWQRAKWSRFTKKIIRYTESIAIKHSDVIVCDNPEIADYYRYTYSVNPVMIPFGGETRTDWNEGELTDWRLFPDTFYLLVARMEPENNIQMILEGFLSSNVKEQLIIVGDCSGRYGRRIFRDYSTNNRLVFLGGVFDPRKLDHLRHYSKAVFHGHSAGGTNPSLLEAMAAEAFIIAHHNPYNKWVLNENAAYFHSADDLKQLIEDLHEPEAFIKDKIRNNLDRINTDFNWDSIVRQYEDLLIQLMEKPRK